MLTGAAQGAARSPDQSLRLARWECEPLHSVAPCGSRREPGGVSMQVEIGGQATGPLRGITVLDLTSVVSGPLCTQTLGDLGAEVIKVETPQGDTSRRLGLPGKAGFAAYFAQFNRNKRSLVLDLKNPAAVEVVLPAGAARRCAARELAAGCRRAARPRLGEALGRESEADLRGDQRLRARGAVPGSSRLRHGGPGAHGLHVRCRVERTRRA